MTKLFKVDVFFIRKIKELITEVIGADIRKVTSRSIKEINNFSFSKPNSNFRH